MLKVSVKSDATAEAVGLLDPTDDELNNLGLFLRQQIDDRFRSRGATGGTPWPDRAIPGNSRALLTGPTARLRESFKHYIKREGSSAYGVVVYSSVPYSYVHQLGTEKYGGPIETIRPKQAKALFIPLSDRATNTDRYEGTEAAILRRSGGMESMRQKGALRTATRGSRMSTADYLKAAQGEVKGLGVGAKLREMGFGLDNLPFQPLKKGRIKNGQLEVYNERKKAWEAGQPDFMFLKKVDIPPRPMLPDSNDEQRAQREFMAQLVKGGQL